MPSELNCTNEEKIRVTISAKTKGGKPALFDGPPTLTPTEGSSATVELDPTDPNAFFLVSGDEPGDSTFLIDGDADLGAGVVDVKDTILLHVIGAQAASVGVVAETPILK